MGGNKIPDCDFVETTEYGNLTVVWNIAVAHMKNVKL